MANTIGRFSYTVTKLSKTDTMPFNPFVVLNLGLMQGNTTDGFPIISPHLMSDAEIDEQVKFLKDDLDAVASKAKRALRTAKEQTQKIVSTRNAS